VYGEPVEPVHSFVIRIWLEEAAMDAEHSHWRGHITHIPSAQRCYFIDLDQVKGFITSFLHEQDSETTEL
jgi:hypothetical protein